MTETTSATNLKNRGTLYYDGTCRFCRAGVARFKGILDRIGVGVAPFENGAAEPEMKLHWQDGNVRGGADAAFFLARRLWWAAPLGWLEWVPGCRWIAHRLYRMIADRRHCSAEGACRIEL